MYVYTTGNGTPTRGEEWFVHSFVLTKAILQPVKAATMCIACLEYIPTHTPPPISPCLSSKPIAPTDIVHTHAANDLK